MSHLNRRELLRRSAAGLPLVALYGLLAEETQPTPTNPLAAKIPHHPARARSVIFLCMGGGPSQVDTFDPKPALAMYPKFPIRLPRITRDKGPNAVSLPSPWKFAQHGESGLWVSELFPQVAHHADKLCVVRSMVCDQIEHSGALRQMFTGDPVFPRPSLGSWTLYGLGTLAQNLPGFVYIGEQDNSTGTQLFSSAFLPTVYEGTGIENRRSVPMRRLLQSSTPPAQQANKIDMLRQLNGLYRGGREEDARLDARIATFELAFQMQAAGAEAFDVARETADTQSLYGINEDATRDFGQQCLLARRLVERGVRFVVCNTNNNWDAHNEIRDHERSARAADRPIAGLLEDLGRRGLLDSTLVVWGGEFGRTPNSQGGATGMRNVGRDHHTYGFTMWLAGGGVRGGLAYGKTDDFGYYAIENRVHVHDLHATILHLLGLDHERLTYHYGGRDYRLTDVEGRVVRDILT